MSAAHATEKIAKTISDEELLHRLQADQAGFSRVAALAARLAGLHLPATSKNLTLVATRLGSMIREQGLKTYSDLVRFLEKRSDLHQEFISALTTNTTQFFREPAHFKVLGQELPELMKSKHRTPGELRVWCAASSTGQEVWTILMSLLENPATAGVLIKIMASDIDTDCLKKAWRAVYTEEQCHGISTDYLEKYFDRAESKDRTGHTVTYYRVKRELRGRVQFARINLIEPFPFEKKFDVVFCRNVMIYFDRPTIEQIGEKMTQAIRPGGLLFLGLSEAGAIRHPQFKSMSPAVFKRTEVVPT